MHRIIVHSVSVIRKGEALLVFEHSLINPELLGIDIRIVGIVWQKTHVLTTF